MRKKIALNFAALLLVVLFATASFAEGLIVTTGAGYKKMLEELSAAYRETGGKIEEMYGGTVGQLLVQVKQGSDVDVIISDKGTLDARSQGIEYDSSYSLGSTPLVLAWRKGITLESPKDLEKPFVKSVCHPESEGAIYGRAAAMFLKSSGIGKNIEGKLSVVSTVPQVFAYLSSGEMDAGFVNRVMVKSGGDKLGGWIEITEGYQSLDMIASVFAGRSSNPAVGGFMKFLKTPEAKAIIKKFGIW